MHVMQLEPRHLEVIELSMDRVIFDLPSIVIDFKMMKRAVYSPRVEYSIRELAIAQLALLHTLDSYVHEYSIMPPHIKEWSTEHARNIVEVLQMINSVLVDTTPTLSAVIDKVVAEGKF